MRISNLSSGNPHFTRAIKVISDTNDSISNYKNHRVDSATADVLNTIKGEIPDRYTKEEAEKIGNFLREQIGDYSERTGLYMTRLDCEVYIFTGKEAVKARKINKRAAEERETHKNNMLFESTEDMDTDDRITYSSEKLMKIKSQNIELKRIRTLKKMIEDGGYCKKDTVIRLYAGDGKNIDSIKYSEVPGYGESGHRKSKTLNIKG